MGLVEPLAGVLGDSGVTVMVQPLLAQPLEDLAGDTAAMRAGLARPLRIIGTTTALDARLPALRVTYGERRHDVGGKVATPDAPREAGKTGARASQTRCNRMREARTQVPGAP